MSRRPSELFGNVSRRREGLPNSSETFRDVAKAFRTLWKRFATSRRPSELFGNVPRRREGLPNSLETFRDVAKAFRTLWKRSATTRRPSELFGNAPLFNPLCPSGISPSLQGEKDSDRYHPAPPVERGSSPKG